MKKRYVLCMIFVFLLWIGDSKALTSGDFTYDIREDNTIEITKYNGSAPSLTIPEKINNQNVTVIGEAAFGKNNTLTSVVIPNTVKEIDTGAFAEAKNLSSVTLGSSVESIYRYAFEQTAITTLNIPASTTFVSPIVCHNCPNFTSFTVNINNQEYSSLDGVLYSKDKTILYSYPTAKVMSVFRVPSTVTVIGENSFVYTKQEKIEFNSNLKEIKSYAFYNSSLRSVTVPANVTKIESSVFENCKSLETAVINANVGHIELGLFQGCEKLKSVELPKNLKWIRSWAFLGCTSLSNITIPSMVIEISSNVFEPTTNVDLSNTTLEKTETGKYLSLDNINVTMESDYASAYEVLQKVNEERAKLSLAPLKMNESLLKSAMQRAAEVSLYYSHTRPSGEEPSTATDLRYSAFGENIAMGQANATAVMNSWMNSTGHRANILNSSYTSIGIGVAVVDNRHFWVQMFTDTNTPYNAVNPGNKQEQKTVLVSTGFKLKFTRGDITIRDDETIRTMFVIDNDYVASAIDLSNTKITYSDPSIATMDNKGNITPKKAGTTTITVTTKKGNKASFKLTVVRPTISLSQKDFTIYNDDDTICLQDYAKVISPSSTSSYGVNSISWKSSDETIATTYYQYGSYKDGCISIKKAGVVKITGTLPNGEKQTANITIKLRTTSLYIKNDYLPIGTGQTKKMTISYYPSEAPLPNLRWKSSNENVAIVSKEGIVTGLKNGTSRISATTENGVTNSIEIEVRGSSPSVVYQTQVQKQGWLDKVANGETSGTTGSGLRMETMKVSLANQDYSGNIEYRTHIQKKGWESTWKKNGEASGSIGEGLRLEAVQIRLTGDMAKNYDIYYRIHSQRFGWLDWAKNGEKAGTAGFGFRVEAIQIKLVKKGSSTPGKTTRPYVSFDNTSVSYQTQVQKQGWLNPVTNGVTSGTVGSYLRMEGLKIKLANQGFTGNIEYRTHIQKQGWESTWKKNGELSGTQGLALRLEALQLRLTGNMAKEYDIYYRVHAQKFGWLGWAKNGESAGTAGYGYRLEAIQIVLVRKGMTPPGSTENHYYSA